MPDDFTVVEDSRRQKADGTWEQKIRICVAEDGEATEDTTLWITSHPYDDRLNKIGTRRFDKVEFKKGEKCKEVVFEFPGAEPKSRYTDVYRTRTEEGQFRDKLHWNLDEFAARSIPPDQSGRAALASILPLAYPFSLEQQDLGPLEFYVSRIACPKPWQVYSLVPAVGEPVTLRPSEKSIPLMVGLRTLEVLPEGYRGEVSIEVSPIGVDDPVETIVQRLRIVKDTREPDVVQESSRIDKGNRALRLAWRISDAVSGLRTPQLRYSRDGGESWRTRWLDAAETELDDGRVVSGLYATTLGLGPSGAIQYELIASDESNNVACTGVTAVVA